MCKQVLRMVGAAMFSLLALPAWAQSTVGELTQKGGVKLSADDLKALMPGARLSGPNPLGREFSLSLDADGTLSGTSQGMEKGSIMLKGKWNISDAGKWCSEIFNQNTRSTDSRCQLVFKLDDKYFVSGSDAPDAKLFPRTIRK